MRNREVGTGGQGDPGRRITHFEGSVTLGCGVGGLGEPIFPDINTLARLSGITHGV